MLNFDANTQVFSPFHFGPDAAAVGRATVNKRLRLSDDKTMAETVVFLSWQVDQV